MSDHFDKLNRNIIDQIQYRGTMVTGEITKDNGDGTYDVKIAQADKAYPYVETAFPNMVFGVGEIVLITNEYGNKEMPRILGYAKKIAQHPIDVEVDYSDVKVIDIGSPATYRGALYSGDPDTHTIIVKENPANASGEITTIEIHAFSGYTMTDVIVATFTQVAFKPIYDKFTARDHVHLADIPGDSPFSQKTTRTVDIDGNPISLDVAEGDFIGIWFDDGGIRASPTGEVGQWWLPGDQTSCNELTFGFAEDMTISLCGTGLGRL